MALIDSFWAKSDGTSLLAHTENVVAGAQNLLSCLPVSEDEKAYFAPRLLFSAIFHDIGKIHPFFQAVLKGDEKHDGFRHEVISAWIVEQFIEHEFIELFAIATHHRGVVNALARKRLESIALDSVFTKHISADGCAFRQTLVQLPEILEQWCAHFGVKRKRAGRENTSEFLSDTLLDILQKRCQKKILKDEKERWHFARLRGLLIAADHLGSALIHNDVPTCKPVFLQDVQPQNKKGERYPLRDFQSRLLTHKGDVILHAPTGSGKTEAALAWITANQQPNTRIFYLLPFTASINAMVLRLQKVFGSNRVTPLHGRTLDFFYEQLQDEASNSGKENIFYPQQQRARTLKSFSSELYFPVKIATPHQIIRYALFGRGWEMALSDYKDACFIIDEFHAYAPFLTGLIVATARWLKIQFNAKLFFMSATIPNFLEKLLLEHVYPDDAAMIALRPSPDSASDREILDRKRHQICCRQNSSLDEYYAMIQKCMDEGKKVLVVVNNVKTAQTVFGKIMHSGLKKMLHGGFHRRDRMDIEKTITDEEKAPQLLVATQAVEVSLDISYDVGFIELAPVDALIQRFGRINRNPKKNTQAAQIFLFEKIIGRTPFYSKAILSMTWQEFLKLDEKVVSEQDLVDVCNTVYGDGYQDADYEDFLHGLNHPKILNYKKQLIAGEWHDWIEDVLGKNNNLKMDVVCGNLVDQYSSFKKQGRYIEAGQLLVGVYPWEIQGAFEQDKELNVIVAHNLEYNSELGYLNKNNHFESACM